MSETEPISYRAFLSHAPADAAWARWLHARLDHFTIPRDLALRGTAQVPSTLRPIFRDRADFAGAEATAAALERSDALIVLCSPAAAAQPALNEEVRLFRARHPRRPVIPVIVEGGAPDCFPHALRFALDARGQVTSVPVAILGPDLREEADGRDLGVAKIVAGLTGLETGQILRSTERERRRRLRRWVAGLGVSTVVLIGLAASAELARVEALVQRALALRKQEEAERSFRIAKQGADALVSDIAAALRKQEGMRTETVRKILGTAEGVIGKLVTTSGDKAELQLTQSAMYEQFAITYASQGDLAKREEAARKAYEIAARLAAAEPDNDGYQQRLQRSTEALATALQDKGDLEAALVQLRTASAIADRLAARHSDDAHPGNGRDSPRLRIGRILQAMGRLDEALEAFRGEKVAIERLLDSDPASSDLQHALGTALSLMGGIETAQGRLAAALDSLQQSRGVLEKLAATDPGRADWQHDVAEVHVSIGSLLSLESKWDEALASFRAAHGILATLAKAGPAGAVLDEDPADRTSARTGRRIALSQSHIRIAQVLLAQGKREEALAEQKLSREILEGLLAADPASPSLAFSLVKVLVDVGDLELAAGRQREALAVLERARGIGVGLVKDAPGNPSFLHALMTTRSRLAELYLTLADTAAARQEVDATRAILSELERQGTAGEDFPGEKDEVEQLPVRLPDPDRTATIAPIAAPTVAPAPGQAAAAAPPKVEAKARKRGKAKPLEPASLLRSQR